MRLRKASIVFFLLFLFNNNSTIAGVNSWSPDNIGYGSWHAGANAYCDAKSGCTASGSCFTYFADFSTDKRVRRVQPSGAVEDWHEGRCNYTVNGDPTVYTWSGYQTAIFIPAQAAEGNAVAPPPAYCPLTKRPINIISGNKYKRQADYPGNSFSPLKFNRYFNSKGFTGVSLGGLWTHTYDAKITLNFDGLIATVVTHTGNPTSFNLINGLWVAGPGIKATLTQSATGEWTLRLVDDKTLQFNAGGQLTSITHRDGRVETLIYDTNNKLNEVRDELDNTILFSYESNFNGKLQNITSPDGRIWTYRYDARDNLEFVDNPDGTTRQYHYEDTAYPFSLTGITDERGVRYASYEYDSSLRATASYLGPVTQVITDRIAGVTLNYVDANSTIVTNSRGNNSTYTFVTNPDRKAISNIQGPGCTSCGDGDTVYEYDLTTGYATAKIKQGLRAYSGPS